MRIFLIGFMGVGKTTVGKKLSQKNSIPFIDLDKEIEEDLKMDVATIFDKYGESFFRREEHRHLKKNIDRFEKVVISTGGGLPCFHENMNLMNESGITCYLQRPVKELFHRLVNSKESRPLIKNIDDNELLDYIENTVNQREKFYKQAHFILNRENQNVEYLTELLFSTKLG